MRTAFAALCQAVACHGLARMPQAPYYRQNANTGHDEAVEEASLDRATEREFTDLFDVVHAARETLGLPPIAAPARAGVANVKSLCKARAAAATEKIGDAAATVAGGRVSLVELGSREGRVAASLAHLEFASVTLVDKAHPDSDEAKAVEGRRVSVGLEHLHLAGLGDGDVACVAKHVCGRAMDYAIRAVAATPPAVVALAPCCYFDVEYRAYPPEGRDFLRDLGIDARRFAMLTRLTQCGPQEVFGDQTIGQAAMDLIDAGRVHYLLGMGLDAAVLPYATPALANDGALESTLIVGWRSPDA